MNLELLRALVREVPDFPEPGIDFKDITPLLADADGFAFSVNELSSRFAHSGIDLVVGIEARGFVFSAPVAHALGVGLVPIRKPGKLPHVTDSVTYSLEYGGDTLEIHTDAIGHGARCLIVDDVLATGGTAAAAAELVTRQGGDLVGFGFLAELGFLHGRAKLGSDEIIEALIVYEE